ncbi:MAG: ribbon-helix-helix domain-containing protein [Methanomassiliicoccales archaeon]|nr:ribbon-helix-helix domain-containing protein [Methanomassiliicoccales archaeon]
MTATQHKRKPPVIGTQVPEEISDLVDAKVEAGEFRSRSDFTLSAIRYYLEYLERKKK